MPTKKDCPRSGPPRSAASRGGGFADCLIPASPKRNFLSQVDEVIDWRPVEKLLKKEYRRTQNAVGNAAYPALPMFKALLLQRWYELSDPGLEEALYDRIGDLRFCGFQMSGPRPDETTICRFHSALLEAGLVEKLFKQLNRQLEKAGLLIKQGAIVDASLVQSQRRPTKVIEADPTEEASDGPTARVVYSDDPEADWTVKMDRPHYGYKQHMAVDSQHGFILGGHVTSASRSDMNERERTLAGSELAQGTLVMADKGYCSRANRKMLGKLGHFDGIMHIVGAANGR